MNTQIMSITFLNKFTTILKENKNTLDKYLRTEVRPPSGQPQSLYRPLPLTSGKPGAHARPATNQSQCLLLPHRSCYFRLGLCPAWCGGLPQLLRTKEEESPMLPCDGGWDCDMGRGQCWQLPLLEVGACVLPCLDVPLSGVESWR